MEYNTSRKKMPLPEYGRNIQKLVEYTKTIEDRDRRNKMAQSIINIMGNIYPHYRDIADFKHKLWDHLIMISEFELDIDSPYDPPPKEKLDRKPDSVPYNNYDIRFKHYGKIIEKMINKAAQYPEGEEKNTLLTIIGNHMKKNYITWNKDTVTDEKIFDDIETLSDGDIKIPRDQIQLSDAKDIMSKLRKKKSNKKNSKQNNKQSNKQSNKQNNYNNNNQN
ncbi:MAG: DUF4290 domain-containing protein [Bacteroidales bacterium]